MTTSTIRRLSSTVTRNALRALFPVIASIVLLPALAQAQTADIVVNHSDAPDPGPAGGVFTYSIRLDNNGPNNATNVRLTDTLPANSTFISAVPSSGSCSAPAGGVFTCTFGNIPFTQPATTSQSVQVKVRLPSAGVYTNQVSATSDTPDPNPGNNTNNAESTTAVSASDLQLTATAPATITAGQNFSYTLTAQNLGPDPVPLDGTLTIAFTVATGVSVTAVPTGTGWSCTPTGGYPLPSGANISCTHAGPLAASTSAPALNVPAVTNTSGTVTAAFAVSSTMPDGDLSNNTATASVNSAAGSDVSISFSAPSAGATVAYNSNVTYTLVPRYNGGLAPGSTGDNTITVTDTLGAGLTYVSANGSPFWSCAAAGQVVTCTHVGAYSGARFTNLQSIGIVATASGVGSLGNSATISIPETDPVPGNNTASRSITSSNAADLQMNKSASLSAVVPNQPFNYMLSVKNLGPVAVGTGQTITVTDSIPAGLTVTAAPTAPGWSCMPATSYPAAGPVSIVCTRTSALGSGTTSPIITIPVQATTSGGPIDNRACAALSGNAPVDSNSVNDCKTVTVNSTTARADLEVVSKTASPGTVNAGDDLTYVISVRNAGPDAATNVTVTDTLGSLVSSGFRSASASPPGSSCNNSANLSCYLGTLNAGATATVTVVVRPTTTTTGPRTNTASINSPDVGDPNRANNSASVTSTVTALVDLQASKTATPSPVKAGTPLTYVATVKNNGPSDAANVTLTDTLPANAAFVSLDMASGGGTCTTVTVANQVTLNCSWASITSGTQNTVTYRVRPLTSAAGGNVVNSAVVATATQELNTTNNRASTTTPVTAAQLDILVNKFDSVDPVLLGQNTVYTIQIDNAGPSLGTDVRLDDVFPAPSPARSAVFSYEGGLTVDNGGTCVEPAAGSTTGTLACSFPSLAAGQRATVTYAMKAQSLTTLGALTGTTYNQASVRVAEPETLLTNNRVVHDTTARRFSENADLGIGKTTTATMAAPGATVDYTLTVHNYGPAASTSAQVIDTLPVGTNFVSAPGCTEASGTVTCLVGTLANGASKTFNLRLKLDDVYAGANPLVNRASVDSPGDTNTLNNSASASTPVAGPNLYRADLSIVKATTATGVAPGGTIDYTLTVSNGGPDASDGATVGDTLPAGTSFVSGAGCAQMLAAVNCAVGPLAVNASKTFSIRLKLDDVYAGANPLVNTATLNAPGDPVIGNNTSPPVSTPVAGPNRYNADLVLTKTSMATSAAPGGTIAYTLTVSNNGPVASDGASVADTLPAGTTFVSGSGCSETGGTIACAVGPLAVNANKAFNVVLKLDDVYAGARPLVNNASVTAPGDPTPGNNSATATTPVVGSNRYNADLSLSKTTPATTVAPGGSIDYDLTVRNNGPDASDAATLADPLPPGTSLVTSDGGCTAVLGSIRCAIGPLAASAEKTFHLRLKLDDVYAGARPLLNEASVDAPGDPDTSNNRSSTSTPVAGSNLYDADLSLRKSSPSNDVAPGGTIDYLLIVTNNGPRDSDGAFVVDTLPGGTTFVSGAGCALQTGRALRCAVGPLAPNATRTFDLQLRLDEVYTGARPLVNTAMVDAPGDPVPGNNESHASTPVVESNQHNADLRLSKVADVGSVMPGGSIGYVLSVRNDGPAASDGASINDPLPAGTTLLSADSGCTDVSGSVRCVIGPLAPLAQKSFHLRLKLADGYSGANPLVNTATVDAPGDPDPSNNGASASTSVDAVPPPTHRADLSLSKTTPAARATPGGRIEYLLTARNEGPDASDGAFVLDPLPAGTAFVSGAGCTLDGRTLRCAIGPLANGASKVFEVQLGLAATYPAGQPLLNRATLEAPGDPNPTNDSAQVSTPVAAPMPTAIPTTSRWALLLMLVLLAAGLRGCTSRERDAGAERVAPGRRRVAGGGSDRLTDDPSGSIDPVSGCATAPHRPQRSRRSPLPHRSRAA